MELYSLPFNYSFERELGLTEKQIRMLAELANAAPVVGELQPDSEFVIVCRQRLSELIERLELAVGVMKCRLERLKN